MSRREIALRPESEVMSENREEEEIEKTNSLSVIFFFRTSLRERERGSESRERDEASDFSRRQERRKKKKTLSPLFSTHPCYDPPSALLRVLCGALRRPGPSPPVLTF